MRYTDPQTMSRAEILAELGELLAGGIQRVLSQECKPASESKIERERLDLLADVEAQCGRSPETAR